MGLQVPYLCQAGVRKATPHNVALGPIRSPSTREQVILGPPRSQWMAPSLLKANGMFQILAVRGKPCPPHFFLV